MNAFNQTFSKSIIAFCLASLPSLLLAQPDTDDDLTPEERAFLNDDSAAQARQISGGELRWVEPSKTLNQYHLKNTLKLTASSLKEGWIDFKQCHFQLDPRIAIEIVYGAQSTRLLTVDSHQNIGKVTPQPFSIELKDISENAQICVSGQTQSLKILGDGRYKIERGPYMRRFLDGYYPMHLSETLIWQGLPLQLQDIDNQQGLGYSFQNQPDQLNANYWFEGIIKPSYNFNTVQK